VKTPALATVTTACTMRAIHNSTPVTGRGSDMASKATKATPKKKSGSKAIRSAAAKKKALVKQAVAE
jgi:hypothetical protein